MPLPLFYVVILKVETLENNISRGLKQVKYGMCVHSYVRMHS